MAKRRGFKVVETSKYGVVRDSLPLQFQIWHDTFEDAKKEAERLANKDNKTFVVLKSVGLARPQKPPVEFVSMEDADVKPVQIPVRS